MAASSKPIALEVELIPPTCLLLPVSNQPLLSWMTNDCLFFLKQNFLSWCRFHWDDYLHLWPPCSNQTVWFQWPWQANQLPQQWISYHDALRGILGIAVAGSNLGAFNKNTNLSLTDNSSVGYLIGELSVIQVKICCVVEEINGGEVVLQLQLCKIARGIQGMIHWSCLQERGSGRAGGSLPMYFSETKTHQH